MEQRASAAAARKSPLPTMELHALLQLARGPGHGYKIMQAIAAETGGSIAPGPGTLYVALRRLRERGLIEPTETPDAPTKRQRYGLTAAGRKTLDEQLTMLDDLLRQARRVGWKPRGRGAS